MLMSLQVKLNYSRGLNLSICHVSTLAIELRVNADAGITAELAITITAPYDVGLCARLWGAVCNLHTFVDRSDFCPTKVTFV